MNLKNILSIAGEPGLFKFVAQGKNAIIVEHVETGKRSSAFSSAKVSSLEDISIFTDSEDLPLGIVFDRIFDKENGGPAIDPKSDSLKLKEYFHAIVPDYSVGKVYISDIKKVFLWYNILQKLNLLVKEDTEKTGEPEPADVKSDEVTAEDDKNKESSSGKEE